MSGLYTSEQIRQAITNTDSPVINNNNQVQLAIVNSKKTTFKHIEIKKSSFQLKSGNSNGA